MKNFSGGEYPYLNCMYFSEHNTQLKEINYFKTMSAMKMHVFNEINHMLSF